MSFFLLLLIVFVLNKVFQCFVLYIFSVTSFIFFYCMFYFIIPRSESLPILQFLYPVVSSAASVIACLISKQSLCTFPVTGVSSPFRLLIYKFLMDFCSNKCTLNPVGFLCIVLSFPNWHAFLLGCAPLADGAQF